MIPNFVPNKSFNVKCGKKLFLPHFTLNIYVHIFYNIFTQMLDHGNLYRRYIGNCLSIIIIHLWLWLQPMTNHSVKVYLTTDFPSIDEITWKILWANRWVNIINRNRKLKAKIPYFRCSHLLWQINLRLEDKNKNNPAE